MSPVFKIKLAIIAGVILLFSALVFIIWYQHKLLDKQKAMETQVVAMKQLQDGIVRNQAQYLTKKDIEKFAKDSGIDLKPIKDDIKNLGAEIKGISKVVSKTPGYSGTNIPSTKTEQNNIKIKPVIIECEDGVVECPNQDPFGYISNVQVLKLDEPLFNNTKIPWGEVKFNAAREKPWDLKIDKRQYTSVTVLSVDENGRHFAHSKMSINIADKNYELPIQNAQFVEEYPESSFRFDPSLYLGLNTGALINPLSFEETPSLEIALFSYGKTKINPDFTFLGVGLGYEIFERDLSVVVSPLNYNIGNNLPLVDNLYIGPTLSVDTQGKVGVFGGINVGF